MRLKLFFAENLHQTHFYKPCFSGQKLFGEKKNEKGRGCIFLKLPNSGVFNQAVLARVS